MIGCYATARRPEAEDCDAECVTCGEWFGFFWADCESDSDGETQWKVKPSHCPAHQE